MSLVPYSSLPTIVKKYSCELNGKLWPNELFRETLLKGLSDSLSLSRIRKATLLPMFYFYELMEADPHLIALVRKLEAYSQDELADRLLNLDEEMEIEKAVLRSRNIQWYLSRKNASKYGDRLRVEVTTLDLNSALEEARSRVIDTVSVKTAITHGDDGSDLL